MPATYTTSLRLVKPAVGDTGWGTTVNSGLTDLVDSSVAGSASITMTAADYTLSNNNGAADEARAMFLVLGGTPGGSYNVICPAASKLYFVANNTGFAQTIKTSAGTGISVPNNARMTVRCDGTNVVVAQNYFGSLTLGAALPIASGGTGSTSTTYCSLTANVTGTLPPANGGTGVANNAASTITITGAYGITMTLTSTTAVTFPTSGTLSTLAGTETLTNKRITARVSSTASIASPLAWNSDSFDEYAATAQAGALTINADAGTPTDGQKIIFRFKDNGTARALTWTTGTSNSFRQIGVLLPTTTIINKTVYVGCIYNAADSRWDAVAVAQET